MHAFIQLHCDLQSWHAGYSTIKQGSILIAPIALILIIIAVVQATVPVPSAAQPPAAAAGSPHAPSETASTGLSANGLVSTLGAGAAQLLSPQRIPALQTVVETVMLTYVEGLEARKACFPDTSAPAAYAAVLAEQGVIYSLGVVAGQYIVPGITNTTVHASMLVMTSSAIAAMDAAVLKAMIENKATKAQAFSTARVVTGCIFALGPILLSSLVQLGHDWLLDAIMKIRLAAKVFSGVTKFKRKPTTPPPQADAAPLNPVQENPASPSGSPITSQVSCPGA